MLWVAGAEIISNAYIHTYTHTHTPRDMQERVGVAVCVVSNH